MKSILITLIIFNIIQYILSFSILPPAFIRASRLRPYLATLAADSSIKDVTISSTNNHRLDGERIRGPITPMGNGIVVRVSLYQAIWGKLGRGNEG